MIETQTDFPYLGGRDYIHGTSILNGFLAALEAAAPGAIKLKRLKFQRPAKGNGRLVVTDGALDDTQIGQANSTLSATVAGKAWRGFFVDEGLPVRSRMPVAYPIAELEASGYGGTCLVSPADRDDLVRVLVEANKRFHEAAFSKGAAVRFGYIEDWAVPPADATYPAARLEARNLIAKETAEGVMTINRLTYTHGGAATSLTLCFDAQPVRV